MRLLVVAGIVASGTRGQAECYRACIVRRLSLPFVPRFVPLKNIVWFIAVSRIALLTLYIYIYTARPFSTVRTRNNNKSVERFYRSLFSILFRILCMKNSRKCVYFCVLLRKGILWKMLNSNLTSVTRYVCILIVKNI